MAADDCVRCGTHVVADASYCHRCGLRLDVVVADLDVFAPSGSEAQGYDSAPVAGERLKTGLGLVAVFALVALAVVYIGSLDAELDGEEAEAFPPDELVDEATEATTDIEERTEEEDSVEPPRPDITARLEGRLPEQIHVDLGGGWPVSVVRHNGEAMVFVAPRSSYAFADVGLDLWAGPDFDQLTKTELVLPEGVEVSDIAVVGDRLLAVGASGDDGLAAWRSDDGRTWIREALPGPEFHDAWPMIGRAILVGEAGVGIVATADFGPAGGGLTAAALDYFGLTPDDSGWVEVYEESNQLTIGAPFGLQLGSVTYEEIGLDSEDWSRIPPAAVWLFDGGGGWVYRQFTEPWVQLFGSDPDGDFLVMEWIEDGPSLLRSTDGRAWTASPLRDNIGAAVPWGEGLLATWGQDLALLDGDHADSLGLRDLAPTAAGGGYHTLRSGAGGAAVAWQSWEDYDASGYPSASLLKDGFVLTAVDGWNLELRRDGDVVWQSSGRPSIQSYVADLETRSIGLLDGDTDELLVAFTLEELSHLANESIVFPKAISDQVLFSPDLENWYRAVIGDAQRPVSVWSEGVELVDDQLVVFGHRGSRQPYSSPSGLELWAFDLPPENE